MSKDGFSLLELLIVTVIMGILVSISYPLYTQHIVTARRAEAKTALYELAQRMEQYYTAHTSYQHASLAKLHLAPLTEHSFYTLSIISQQQGQSYLLTATPQGSQAEHDQRCGSLTLDGKGNRGITGNSTVSDCWGS